MLEREMKQRLLNIINKTVVTTAIGAGMALSGGCGGEIIDETTAVNDEAVAADEIGTSEDAISVKACEEKSGQVIWVAKVNQTLTSAKVTTLITYKRALGTKNLIFNKTKGLGYCWTEDGVLYSTPF